MEHVSSFPILNKCTAPNIALLDVEKRTFSADATESMLNPPDDNEKLTDYTNKQTTST